jgi:hypothetical protein
MTGVRLIVMLVALCLALDPQQAQAQPVSQNRTMSSDFIVDPPTLKCAGFAWKIFGDENRNASVKVNYRKTGTQVWAEALPLLRVGGEKIYGHEQRWLYATEHMLAGSIFGLEEGASYECRFVLADPDGVDGLTEQRVTVSTRREPKPSLEGRTLHVYPPGHQGRKETPAFTGLNAAYYGEGNTGDWWNVPDARVRAGDVILVHAGLYKANRLRYADSLALDFHGAYVFTQKGTPDRPITIKAAGDGEVIFDGDGSYRLFDVMAADYHYFEGLTIRNTDVAFYAGWKNVMGSMGLTVKNCNLYDVGIAVMTYSEDSRDFYIADNVIRGRHDPDTLVGWYGFKDPSPLTSYYAIKVYGQGHVVCYNDISFFHDGLCIDTHGVPEAGKECVSIDFYGNDIFNVSDDFIEADGGVRNIRVFENRGVNAYHAALSAQPMFGGPVYFIRNICYNVQGTAMKYTVRPAGILTYQNTFVAEASISGYSNGHFRNNLFIGVNADRPVLQSTTFTDYSTSDYNGYGIKPGDGVKYRLRYPPQSNLNHADIQELPVVEARTLSEFQKKTGYEVHSVELEPRALFKGVTLPDPKLGPHIYPRESLDFSLVPSGKAVDAGCILPNVTDGYKGKAPDLGALEVGQTPLHYGPRR